MPDAAPPPCRGVREPVRLALALFSVVALPGAEPDRADGRTLRRAVLLAPAVGLVLGLAGAAVVKLGRIPWTKGSVLVLAAIAGLIVVAALSGGRTFAGLASAADGPETPETAETAGRRQAATGVGGAGVAAVAFAIAAQVAALQACIASHRGTLAIVLAAVAGRVAMVLVCAGRQRAVRDDALAARLAGLVSPWVAGVMSVALMVVAAVAGRFDIDGGRVRLGVHAIVATAVALAVALVTRWWLARRFRGLTVATLGATSEAASAAVLLVLAAHLPEAALVL